MDFEGAVAPMGTIQRLVGKIPVLGKVLAGRDNKGIIATSFSVKGSASEPDVSVQALSTLTPGITRELLRVFPGD